MQRNAIRFTTFQNLTIPLNQLPMSSVSSLCSSLNGQWALLLSHPEDFYWSGFESDRWLVLLEAALSAAKVKLLTLASKPFQDCVWFTAVSGAQMVLNAGGSILNRERVGLHRQRSIRGISPISSRFIIVIDAVACPRWEYTYALPEKVPSIFDLVTMTHKLRNRVPVSS